MKSPDMATSHIEQIVHAAWFILPLLAMGGVVALGFVLWELRAHIKQKAQDHRRGRRKRLVQWL